jgi:hypothetical protein
VYAKLRIAVIAASSPQAKGRVERVHGIHEDRLVEKSRRKDIRSHQAANVYLQREYLPEHNRRFTRLAAQPENYHRRASRAAELGSAFSRSASSLSKSVSNTVGSRPGATGPPFQACRR